MIPSPALGGRQQGRSTCLPSAHARLIISSVEISFRTAIYMATVRASRHSGRGEDTPLDGGGMAFPLGGVKGFTCAYQLGTQDIFLSGTAWPEGVPVAGGEVGGRDMAHLCQT